MGSFHHRDPGLIGLLGRRDYATRAHGSAPANACRSESPDDLTRGDAHCHSCAAVPGVLRARDDGPMHHHHHVAPSLPPGPVPVCAATGVPQQRVYYSIIADGIHCHKYSVSMAHRLHSAGLVLITDAMAAMGLPPGTVPVLHPGWLTSLCCVSRLSFMTACDHGAVTRAVGVFGCCCRGGRSAPPWHDVSGHL